jgi:ATP-dependent DNA helicase RecG
MQSSEIHGALMTAQAGRLCHWETGCVPLAYARGSLMDVEHVKPEQLTLSTPLGAIEGVRGVHAKGLELLGVRTVAELVKHQPLRHEVVQAEGTISDVKAEELVTARGEVTATRIAGVGRKQRFQAVLMDETGRLDLVWFNAPFMKDKVYPGLRLRVHGKARKLGPGVQLANPKYEVLADDYEPDAKEGRVRPVYPASERVSSADIEKVVGVVLDPALKLIEDHLSAEYLHERSMVGLSAAYRMTHQPGSLAEAREARRRLAYDELLLLQLGVFLRRAQLRTTMRAVALKHNRAIDEHIRARFPFALTGAQERVVSEIAGDLSKATPSNRLIQGDVGSGKTIVALYAMLMAVASGHQAALMAPTEILAEQHFLSISRVMAGSSVRIGLLTGSLAEADRERMRGKIAAGEVDLVIGTHALISQGVGFKSLAVAVIDEQHRFGVHQRAALREMGQMGRMGQREEEHPLVPHTIVMTATPIPRTLALTLFGDLDVSVIDELPPGRTAIATRVVSPAMSGEVYRYVRKRLDEGDQAYVVVPAIDTGASTAGEGGDAELNDLRTVMARLEAHELAGKRVAALHGRLKTETREAVMQRFRAGAIDALVATTVIEVGVDVPNATVMVVEHAERFGLAQLHQLRGRVGRGSKKSVCVLIGEASTGEAQARLGVMAGTIDGFELAEKDLEIRGPGEVFGLKQAGAPPLKVADFMLDRELLAMARRDAEAWIERSPRLDGAEEGLVRKRLLKAHGQWLGIGDVG